MDTNQVTKEEILLLTRYLLDLLRRGGIKRSADKFAREAQIDEQQPLVGSVEEYIELWQKECRGPIDYWTYFCHKKLKTLRENTFQGNALTNTATNQQPSSVDRSGIEVFNFPGVISGSSRVFLLMLKRYIFKYIVRDLHHDRFAKEEETDAKEQDVGSVSKKRRLCTRENVKIEN